MQVDATTRRAKIRLNSDLTMAPEAMMPETVRFYEPETIAIMKVAFDEACASLPLERATQSARTRVAECILKDAAAGERDPANLCAHALRSVTRAA
jgi:hypothetical protein